MRVVLAGALLLAAICVDVQPAPAADLALKARRAHRVHALGRPWCVIENLGAAIWFCAPTLAQCRPMEIPGTSLYCVRDPIPGRPYALR